MKDTDLWIQGYTREQFHNLLGEHFAWDGAMSPTNLPVRIFGMLPNKYSHQSWLWNPTDAEVVLAVSYQISKWKRVTVELNQMIKQGELRARSY